MKHLLLCFCLFFIATAVGYGQTDFYVDGERGVDDTNTNNGSENLPWKTIAFAVEQVNQVAEDEGIVSISVFPAADGYTDSTITITRPMSIGRATGPDVPLDDPVIVQPSDIILFDVKVSLGRVVINDLVLQGNTNATGMVVSESDSLNITNSTFQDFAQAIQFNDGNFSKIQVQGNTFQTSTTDIMIGSTVTSLDSLLINSNRFDYPTGGSVSIDNQTDLIVNAEYNWWGAVAADSVEKAVSNNVDYSPWLNTNNNVAIGNGFEGDETSVRIDQDSPSATGNENNLQTAYASAQEDATLILTGSSQPYPSLVADSLPITLASEAPSDIIMVDTLVIELADPLDSVALSNGLLLINDSLALLSGNLQTLDTTSQVILGDNIEQVDESDGRLVGNFITTPRDVGQEIFSILGVKVGSGSLLENLSVNRINGVGSAVEVNGNQSIDTKWIFSADNTAEGSRNIVFEWYSESDNESRFDTDSTAFIWRSDDQGASWQSVAEDNADVGSAVFRQVSAVAVANFPTQADVMSTIWTVSSINRPLPVILTSFTAYQEESTVHLTWSTASEINSDYFQIQRSTDGSDFQSLSRQAAAGDSQQELTYRYADEGVANRFSGTLYYRLKTVDFDGSFEYSDITAVALNQRPGLRVHADRANGEIKLFSDWKENRYTVQVADMLGRVLLEAPLQISEDQDYTLSLSSLSPAVYVLRCIGVLDVQTSRFKLE